MNAFASLFTSMFSAVTAILLPSGGIANSPVAIVAWFGLLTGPLAYAVSFLKRLAA